MLKVSNTQTFVSFSLTRARDFSEVKVTDVPITNSSLNDGKYIETFLANVENTNLVLSDDGTAQLVFVNYDDQEMLSLPLNGYETRIVSNLMMLFKLDELGCNRVLLTYLFK